MQLIKQHEEVFAITSVFKLKSKGWMPNRTPQPDHLETKTDESQDKTYASENSIEIMC